MQQKTILSKDVQDVLYNIEKKLSFLLSAASSSYNSKGDSVLLEVHGSGAGLELFLDDIWTDVQAVREALKNAPEGTV